MRRMLLISLAVLACVCAGAGAQGLDLSVSPGADLPLGPSTSGGVRLYDFGGGANLEVGYSFPGLSFLSARGLLGYDMIETPSQKSLSLVSVGVGVGLNFTLASFLDLRISAAGGLGVPIYLGEVGSNFFVTGQIAALFPVFPSLRLGVGVSYKQFFPTYYGVGAFVGAVFRPVPEKPVPKLQIPKVELLPVFPVFYKYYDDNPLGTLSLLNGEKAKITDIKVSVYAKSYMDSAKACPAPATLAPGESAAVPLLGLFTTSILDVTQGTKTPLDIVVSYQLNGSARSVQRTETLTILDRNAMIWDDTRKAAAFVTELDPGVLTYAKGIAGMARETGNQAVSLIFRQAMALFESFATFGLRYVVDPASSYTQFSAEKTSVDFLQFPIQTLTYKAGDCDDLSILYCALLKSIGIEPAFITVPGHIFAAFNLSLSAENAGKLFSNTQDLVAVNGDTWIPVEITMLREGFLSAWHEGAREWREASAAGKAEFVPISDAWKLYPPTGFLDKESSVVPPDVGAVTKLYTTALATFIKREVDTRAAEIQGALRTSPRDPKLLNKLGVLYAQFGMLDDAAQQFTIASRAPYLPAVVNLGLVYALRGDGTRAAAAYKQVLQKDPENTSALLGMARLAFDQEDYASAGKYLDTVAGIDPKLARQYSYLASRSTTDTRGADLDAQPRPPWLD